MAIFCVLGLGFFGGFVTFGLSEFGSGAFITHFGKCIDEKTPLLRSMDAVKTHGCWAFT